MNKDFSWIAMDGAALNSFMAPHISALDSNTKFNKKVLTYAWLDSNNPVNSSDLFPERHNGPPTVVEPLKHHRDVAKATLGYLGRVIDIDFQEVEQGSDLKLGISDLNIGGYATFPSVTQSDSNRYLNIWDKDSTATGNTFAHEIGHNLGLKHTEDSSLPRSIDYYEFSTMSYEIANSIQESFGVLDYAALISKYGVSTNNQGLNFNFNSRNPLFNSGVRYEDLAPPDSKNYSNYMNIVGNELDIVLALGVELFTLTGTRGFDSVNLSRISPVEGSSFTNLKAGIFSTTPSQVQGEYFDSSLNRQVKFDYGPNISRPDIKFYEGPIGSGLGLEKLTLTNQADKVLLGDIFDEVNTGAGNDEFIGFGDQTKLNGGSGMDSWSTGTARASATVSKSLGVNTLSTSGKNINFEGIERLQFSDSKIAFDLDGNAGKVAKIIGAVFGSSLVSNKEYVGVGLSFLDSGTSYENLMKIALEFKFGKTPSNSELVKTLYSNVAGTAPSAQEEKEFVSLLNNGTFNQTSLSLFAAEHPLNAQRIELAGFTDTGIEYV